MQTSRGKKQQIINSDGFIFRIWISIVFINLMAQAINITEAFIHQTLDVKSLENLPHENLYFNIYTNGFTLILVIFMIRVSSYGFIDTTRIVIILLLEIYDTILHYAARYYEYGLMSGGKLVHSYIDSIYFSVVTWTTVGFGDLVPPHPLKYFVASEAMVGQLLQSVSIAAIIGILNPWFNVMRGGEDKLDLESFAEGKEMVRSRYASRPSKSWRKIANASRAQRRRMRRT